MSERLEDIKKRTSDIVDYGGEIDHMDVAWLLSRVEELEEENKNYWKACSAWEVLESYGRKENERYRQALEFYADKDNYEVDVISQWEPVIPVVKDNGEKARKALEDDNNV